MASIAIVGGNSSLGKYLIPRLSHKHSVVTLGRNSCNLHCNILSPLESVSIPMNTDVVVHLAAAFKGSTDREIIETEEVNALGTLKVCMAAKRANVKHLILVSSQYVLLSKSSSYYNIYSISKKHSEELALYYCNLYNIPITVLRPSQIYDSKGLFRKSQPFFYMIADNAEQGKDILIYGSNDALRNYIYIDDLTQIISIVINKKHMGVYSCFYTKNISLTQIANAAQASFNKGGRIIFIKDRSDIQNNISNDNFELYRDIGFYPLVDIRKGMGKIAEYRSKENR